MLQNRSTWAPGTWLIEIKGNEASLLRYLGSQSLSGAVKISEIEGKFFLTTDVLAGITDPQQAHDIAQRVVTLLQTALDLCGHRSDDLLLAGISRVEVNRPPTQFIFPIGIPTNEYVGIPGIHTGSSAVTAPNVFAGPLDVLEHALTNKNIGRAFRLFSGVQADWSSLYKIYEIIEINVGKVWTRGWVSKDEINRFTQTANSTAALGDDARHSNYKVPAPAEPMSLDEARTLIRKLLTKWSQSVGST